MFRPDLSRVLFAAALFACATFRPVLAGTFLEVGKQPPITILINGSPWLGGFQAVAGLYEQQTGNKINLDVTPYPGMLEKARNAVRGTESPEDILNLDSGWTIEFYEAGFLVSLDQVEPGYAMPNEVLTCGDSYFWNPAKRYRVREGGALMAIPPNCNTHVLIWRKDLFDKAGLAEPKTYDDVLNACAKLQSPKLYGFATRGEGANGIRFDWTPFMLGYGAHVVADPANGDYTVTINSPAGKEALDKFIEIMKRCAPPNAGALGQADVIQLMAVGKAAMVEVVIAAWAGLRRQSGAVRPHTGCRHRQLAFRHPEKHSARAAKSRHGVLQMVSDQGCANRLCRGRRYPGPLGRAERTRDATKIRLDGRL
jgi:multiple sugar transport system substrate-binding protein